MAIMSIRFRDIEKKPQRYPKVVREDPTIDNPGFVEVDGYRLRPNLDLMPQRGMQENLCASECNLIFLGGSGTSGKMQPYDAKICTPKGFVDMGSLKVGDIISSANGGRQVVEKIYEHGLQDVWRITFADGRTTECGKEHLWKFAHRTDKVGFSDYEVDTFEKIKTLLDNGEKVAIPMCGNIDFDCEESLPMRPYTLGALIGDGSFRFEGCPVLTTDDKEVIAGIEAEGYKCNFIPSAGRGYRVNGNNMSEAMRVLGLYGKFSYEKEIPEQYKFASVETRIALMKGLLDSDGTVDKLGHISYSTSSSKLANDIQFVVRSLGGRCSISTKNPVYIYNGEKRKGRTSFVLNINFGDRESSSVFSVSRHLNRLRGGFYNGRGCLRNIITSYEYVGKKQCRCIRVSSPDHLYITDDFIVTHNTFGALLASMKGLGYQNYTARIVTMQSKDNEVGTSMKRDAEQVFGGFAGCNFTTSGGLTAEWPQWNNSIKFIHVNFNIANPNEWELYKGHCKANTAIFFYWDEVTGVKEWKKFAYMFSRNRDSSGAMRPKTIVSFNPEYKHWTTRFLKDAGYLDDNWYLKEDMNGVVTYFYSGEGDDVTDVIHGRTREEVVAKAHLEVSPQEAAFGMKPTDLVKSFTIYMGSPVDNKILANITKGESIANLAAVGKTEGAKMHRSYFGPNKNDESKITRRIIEQIFEAPRSGLDEEKYATLDISGGGDIPPMLIWRGNTIIGAEDIDSDDPVVLRNWVRSTLAKWGVPIKNFAYDGGGMGFFLKEFKDGRYVVNNMRPVQEIDSYGNPTEAHKEYYDLRSQLLAKLEAMLLMGEISCEISPAALLHHTRTKKLVSLLEILDEERAVFAWEDRADFNNKIKAVTKQVFKSKFGYSPDWMDSVMLRMIFNLDARPRKAEVVEMTEADYYQAFNCDTIIF